MNLATRIFHRAGIVSTVANSPTGVHQSPNQSFTLVIAESGITRAPEAVLDDNVAAIWRFEGFNLAHVYRLRSSDRAVFRAEANSGFVGDHQPRAISNDVGAAFAGQVLTSSSSVAERQVAHTRSLDCSADG